ncbi:MAG TPA: hypothetical protein VKO20_01605 [Desulfosalsimonadaceae bacterium]|nr:hypothetical protein [Desulfosalsimonadaceae bacterium]
MNVQKCCLFHAYLRAGRLLHVITLLELAVLAGLAPGLLEFRTESAADTIFDTILSAFLVSLPILSQLDARSRFQSYKRVKDNLFTHGFDQRILRPFLRSRCQRDAALAAAEQLGFQHLCRSYYRSQGYRWYHILPDFVFSNAGLLISRQFWQSTFFSRTYRSRTGF